MIIKGTEIYDLFLNNIDKLNDYDRLKKLIEENLRCLPNPGKRFGFCLLQSIDEFTRFLLFLNSHKINRYLEIGLYHGGTLFTIDSYLRVINKNYEGCIGYDIKIQIDNYKEYTNKFSNCQIIELDSKKLELEGGYDLCLIDGDHSYEGCKNDYLKVRNNCRYIVFHDILNKAKRKKVPEFWEEIKKTGKYYEFIDNKYKIGIGILENNVLKSKISVDSEKKKIR